MTMQIVNDVRPITHATRSGEDVDRILKSSRVGPVIFDQIKSDWPNSRYALEYPAIDFDIDACRFEVHVARRSGEPDKISVGIVFPESFPLRTTHLPVDLQRGTIFGSDKPVLGDGHVRTLRFFALGAS